MVSATGKKAIVVGASSGIGRALAKALAREGYEVGLAARRIELLETLKQEIPSQTYIKRIDVSQTDQAMRLLDELIAQMGEVDLIVLNSGINSSNLQWPQELETINVNVLGFAALANVAVRYFLRRKSGHLVGISSIAGLRGSANCPAYNASKAFVSNYLEGLRYRLARNNIYVTDIRPGLVDTEMTRGYHQIFWMASAEAAAEQIFRVIQKKKKSAYITRRWLLIAWLAKLLPDWVYRLRYE